MTRKGNPVLYCSLRVAHHRGDALALAPDDLGDEGVGRQRRAAHDRAVGHAAPKTRIGRNIGLQAPIQQYASNEYGHKGDRTIQYVR